MAEIPSGCAAHARLAVVACSLAISVTGGVARAETVTLTSATRSVQANATTHSVTTFGPWNDAVASGQTNATQNSLVSTAECSIVGGLHAHWPSTNSASTSYEVHFTLTAAMHYDLSGWMLATISSFAFTGPGTSTLTLSGSGGTIVSYVIQPFSGSPTYFDLDSAGLLQPGAYTLQLQASGTGFGSSLMTSAVSDASHEIHFTLTGLCGAWSGGSCFVAQSTPFCSDADCCGLVCTVEPFCCDIAWDSGCVGAAGQLCASPCPADIDGSGTVEAGDLAALLGAWGGGGPADLDGDGSVGSADLGLLLGAWGACP